MLKPRYFLLACFCIASAHAEDISPVTENETPKVTISDAPDSKQMETDLQQLNWDQFKSVIEAVPKMKADVDAYGQLGWQYVQMNYKTYKWKKSIDRLGDGQKHQLAELIYNARQPP